MRMRDFIRANREQIDLCINTVRYRHDGKGGKGTIPNPPPKYNDEERHEWVINDEGMYRWARSEGCKI